MRHLVKFFFNYFIASFIIIYWGTAVDGELVVDAGGASGLQTGPTPNLIGGFGHGGKLGFPPAIPLWINNFVSLVWI